MSPEGVRRSYLEYGPVDAEGPQFRCNVTYRTDKTANVIGGSVVSSSTKLEIAGIKDFTLSPDSDIITGDTVSFTCLAAGSSVPTFSFTTDGSSFDSSRFSYVSGPNVTRLNEDVFQAVYVTKTKHANILTNGQDIFCKVKWQKAPVLPYWVPNNECLAKG